MEMTIEQAIRLIHPDTCEAALGEVEACDGMDFYESQIAVINKASLIAVECMEKQIPKKPNITLRGTTGWNTEAYCPVCKTMVHSSYCSGCGQAIKWGD